MNRRTLLKSLSAASTLYAAQQQPDPQHPVVNLDQHGESMPSGMDMSSDNALRAQAVTGNRMQPVLTRSGGNLRHGVYQDTILTPDRLIKDPPRKAFSVQLPGDARGMEAQPLIVPQIQLADS